MDGGIKASIIRHLPKVAHAKYDKGNRQEDGTITPYVLE